MSKFRNQIEEDIRHIQEEFGKHNPFLKKDEYAFNHWVLTRLYSIDDEVVQNSITEYRDDGIDCFVFFEDTKDLYIIQNKYYSEQTKLDKTDIDDFLNRPLKTLDEERYNRSKELQEIYSKYLKKSTIDQDFKVHLCLYVSNQQVDEATKDKVKKFTNKDVNLACYVDAKIFDLNDIRDLYFDERIQETKSFNCDFFTINKGTALQIKEDYNLPNLIEAYYVLTPVSLVYDIYKNAKQSSYSLFDENIRDFLGTGGINAKIAMTLRDKNDRANFFYYNNGITVICEKIKQDSASGTPLNRKFTAFNPQIVNGCQTVNTIYNELNKYSEADRKTEFECTYVMVKLLVLNPSNSQHKKLYEDIVKYNNSQNAINDKAFAANKELFLNHQIDFQKRGFLLAVKQSDKYQFSKRIFNDFRAKCEERAKIFSLELSKTQDIIIPLEKYLQVILAFYKDGFHAFTKKNQVLKMDSKIYLDLTSFIKDTEYTLDDLLNLYLFFLKAEREKKASEDLRTPVPFYVIGFFGSEIKKAKRENAAESFKFVFSNSEIFKSIYKFYKSIANNYRNAYEGHKKTDYNTTIKLPIDEQILNIAFSSAYSNLDQADKEVIKIYREKLDLQYL